MTEYKFRIEGVVCLGETEIPETVIKGICADMQDTSIGALATDSGDRIEKAELGMPVIHDGKKAWEWQAVELGI